MHSIFIRRSFWEVSDHHELMSLLQFHKGLHTLKDRSRQGNDNIGVCVVDTPQIGPFSDVLYSWRKHKSSGLSLTHFYKKITLSRFLNAENVIFSGSTCGGGSQEEVEHVRRWSWGNQLDRDADKRIWKSDWLCKTVSWKLIQTVVLCVLVCSSHWCIYLIALVSVTNIFSI